MPLSSFSTPILTPLLGGEYSILAFLYAHIFKKGRMRRIDLVHGHEPSTPPLYMLYTYICILFNYVVNSHISDR